MSGQRRKALVTGGAGFLGEHLIQQLVDSKAYEVSCFDLRTVAMEGCKSITGDITNLEDVERALAGIDIVFHAATCSPTAQNAATAQALMVAVNVKGTENVIAACLKQNVKHLVFTSSASVVFAGTPLVDVDESYPYAENPMDYYTGTKMQAEKLVLAANSDRLATCALRPSGIFGPGQDRLLVPGIVERAKLGKMKYVIGNGKNLFDWTYVGNVAQAHLLAAEALKPGSKVAGQAYFITNGEPYPFWAMLGDISGGLGYDRPHIHLPVWLMMFFAVLATLVGSVFGFKSDLNPMRVRISSVQRTMKVGKARTDLGYVPKVGLQEGIRLTLEGFKHLAKDAGNLKQA